MPRVELIPLDKGNPVILDDTTITTIGRTRKIGCPNNRISRNHVQLFIKPDGTVWIKSIHHNPTFYKTKTNQIVSLTKDKEYQLYNDDQFGLLPDEYFYRVSIKSNDADQNSTINSSTTPKSPIQEKEISTLENHEKEKSESVLDQNRTLPSGMYDSSASRTNHEEELSQAKTTTPSLVKNRTDAKKSKGIVYDSDVDDEPITTASATEKVDTVNRTDSAADHPTSSTVADSTRRERCPYGTSCYRKNPIHRQQASHPDDSDWDSDEEDKDDTKLVCPYGNECYRTNPDHLNEYHHPKKRSVDNRIKQRSGKRKSTAEYEDDDSSNDDDDEDIGSTDCNTGEEETDDDLEWKPHKNSRYSDETDNDSTDDSDKELAKQEAADFIKNSTADRHDPVIKKPRVDND